MSVLSLSVMDIALRVMKQSPVHYNKKFIRLIPQEILKLQLSTHTLMEVGEQIDSLRFKQEERLAQLLDLDYKRLTEPDLYLMRKVIENKRNNLRNHDKASRIVNRILFLSQIAQIIIHQ